MALDEIFFIKINIFSVFVEKNWIVRKISQNSIVPMWCEYCEQIPMKFAMNLQTNTIYTQVVSNESERKLGSTVFMFRNVSTQFKIFSCHLYNFEIQQFSISCCNSMSLFESKSLFMKCESVATIIFKIYKLAIKHGQKSTELNFHTNTKRHRTTVAILSWFASKFRYKTNCPWTNCLLFTKKRRNFEKKGFIWCCTWLEFFFGAWKKTYWLIFYQ